ncbi:Plasmid stabilization system protein [Bacteroidales bacterium Barb4]|nr:Plasmid stabilization system protein [Bacteroidales bacterium Barb4]
MKKYTVIISVNAKLDIADLDYYIRNGLKAPSTADRYVDGLYKAIRMLSSSADSKAVSQSDYIQSRYGPNARHIVFKKMVVIYRIEDDFVHIKRVIPGSLIR